MQNIFWAHSPIGYEVFKSFRDYKLTHEHNSLLITSRNFFPLDSDCNLGLPEEYIWMNDTQFATAKNKIIEFIQKCNSENYILYIPQTANFFIRCLIESPFCKGFYIFDEGSAARYPFFQTRMNFQGFYKYKLRGEPGLLDLFDFLKIDSKFISECYEAGVPFYEATHPKLLGFMSHFKNSFPGKDTEPIARAKILNVSVCSNYALLLMPPFHVELKKKDFNVRFNNLVNSVNGIKILDKELKIIIKFHPHDGNEIKNEVLKHLNLIQFEKFCKENNISEFREPAFMGFKLYIGFPNSTIEFLKEVGGHYIAF
jgi:hypothetical protein